nr:nuclear transport factor 2 family protein [Jannaschia formosa]
MLDQLLAAERRVWDALVAGDAGADRAALHPDFLGLYPEGYADRDAHVAQLDDGPTVGTFTLTEARACTPGDGLGLLTYRADFTRIDGRRDAMRVASLWRATPEGWVNLFSMDAPIA